MTQIDYTAQDITWFMKQERSFMYFLPWKLWTFFNNFWWISLSDSWMHMIYLLSYQPSSEPADQEIADMQPCKINVCRHTVTHPMTERGGLINSFTSSLLTDVCLETQSSSYNLTSYSSTINWLHIFVFENVNLFQWFHMNLSSFLRSVIVF